MVRRAPKDSGFLLAMDLPNEEPKLSAPAWAQPVVKACPLLLPKHDTLGLACSFDWDKEVSLRMLSLLDASHLPQHTNDPHPALTLYSSTAFLYSDERAFLKESRSGDFC